MSCLKVKEAARRKTDDTLEENSMNVETPVLAEVKPTNF